MKSPEGEKGSERKIFPWLFAVSGIVLISFYFAAYKNPDIFSPDGSMRYFYIIPYFAWKFKGLFPALGAVFFLAVAGIILNKDFF
jgi:hypothetical protein